MKNKKKDRLYLCFRYKCRECPKNRQCEEYLKEVENENTKKKKKDYRLAI